MVTISNTYLSLAWATDGTMSVSMAGKQVASGHMQMYWDMSGIFTPNAPDNLPIGTYTLKSITQINSYTVQVTHVYPMWSAIYTIILSGEDIKVSVRMINNSKTQSIHYIQLDMPTFQFSRNADGILKSWHWTYLQARTYQIMHPSYMTPFGGSYAHDDTFGLGFSTRTHLQKLSLFMAGWQADGIIPATCTPSFYANVDLGPLDGKTVEFIIRVSPNRDWKHLMANYYADYKSQIPAQQYVSDQRPWSFFASADPAWVTPQDPYGFNGDSRRFDLPQGAALFVQDYGTPIPGIGQGTILWNPQGVNPRGAAYRPDFDIFPPVIQPNMEIVLQGYEKLGLKLGLCARPMDMIWPATWTSDGTARLDGTNPDQQASLWGRFQNVINQGYNAFYLDSCGTYIQDVSLFRYLRQQMGPNVQCFTEYCSDLTIPYMGRFGIVVQDNPAVLMWMGPGDMDIYRWLMPQMGTACFLSNTPNLEAMYQAKLTPMPIEYMFSTYAPQLSLLNAKYLDTNNQWLSNPNKTSPDGGEA